MSAPKTSPRTTGSPSRPTDPASGGSNGHKRLIDVMRELDTDPALTDDAIADALTRHLRDMGDVGWLYVRIAIRGWVDNNRRLRTRHSELQHQRTFAPGDGTVPAVSTVRRLSLDQLRDFVGKSFKIPGVDAPKLGENVTVDDWDARAAALEGHLADVFSKIELYRSIANTLRSLKADTIAEALERKRAAA